MTTAAVELRRIDRPQRIVKEQFEAFQLRADGSLWPQRFDGTPEPVATAETLAVCVEAAKIQCAHKSQFAVIQRGSDGDTLHIYQVKQRSTPTYVYRDYQHHRVQPLYETLVAVVRLPEARS